MIFLLNLIICENIKCKEMDALQEHISFNPWRSTFRPLGSVGRAREFVYEESLKYRRSINGIQLQKEPESLEEMKKVFIKK